MKNPSGKEVSLSSKNGSGNAGMTHMPGNNKGQPRFQEKGGRHADKTKKEVAALAVLLVAPPLRSLWAPTMVDGETDGGGGKGRSERLP